MDSFPQTVSQWVFALKKHTTDHYFTFMASSKGHEFTRKVGPCIVLCFFVS